MKPEVKSEWIAALRGGKYEQCQEVLRADDNRFCCLGVLCDLVAPDRWGSFHEDAWWFKEPEVYVMPDPETFIITGLSRTVAQDLADMNDEGKSFFEIADYIEKNV